MVLPTKVKEESDRLQGGTYTLRYKQLQGTWWESNVLHDLAMAVCVMDKGKNIHVARAVNCFLITIF